MNRSSNLDLIDTTPIQTDRDSVTNGCDLTSQNKVKAMMTKEGKVNVNFHLGDQREVFQGFLMRATSITAWHSVLLHTSDCTYVNM